MSSHIFDLSPPVLLLLLFFFSYREEAADRQFQWGAVYIGRPKIGIHSYFHLSASYRQTDKIKKGGKIEEK